ncbi:MAG: NUDIX domain-containing protein [Candidatus Woesebacteria bacterium]
MKRWTLGFVFTTDFSRVLLIHKEHPASQAGKWNGLGGKYEIGENAQECIAREVEEESQLRISALTWRDIGKVHGEEWEMDILTAVYLGDADTAQTMTDEKVAWFPIHALPEETKHNLQWMIPLCIDALKKDEIEKIDIQYTSSNRWK